MLALSKQGPYLRGRYKPLAPRHMYIISLLGNKTHYHQRDPINSIHLLPRSLSLSRLRRRRFAPSLSRALFSCGRRNLPRPINSRVSCARSFASREDSSAPTESSSMSINLFDLLRDFYLVSFLPSRTLSPARQRLLIFTFFASFIVAAERCRERFSRTCVYVPLWGTFAAMYARAAHREATSDLID